MNDITREMIENGYKKGIVRLIKSPNGDGIVCEIGETPLGSNWFYFGGLTAEEYENINDYTRDISEGTIIDEIHRALLDFQNDGDELQDEYDFYYFVLIEM